MSQISATTPALIAQQLREAIHGKNWTWVWLDQTLEDLQWEEATRQIHGLNSIATLVYHIHYYIRIQNEVLQGKPLDGSDKDSFNGPPIKSEADWQELRSACRQQVEKWFQLVESMPEEKLREPFDQGKYGNWFRNLCGMIEHLHYHMGQVVLIKKMIRQG